MPWEDITPPHQRYVLPNHFVVPPPAEVPKEPMRTKREQKDGFTLIPIRRGGTQIEPLLDLFEKIEKETGETCYICGGFARWCASPLQEPYPPSDLDIYSEGKKAHEAISKILNDLLRTDKSSPIAVSYVRPSDKGSFFTYLPPIQLIKPRKEGNLISYGKLEDIINHFDFTVIRVGIQDSKWVMADMNFVEDEINHVLYIKRVQCPVSSLGRCLKYAKKGYYLPPHESLKMLVDWDGRSDSYKKKLTNLLEKLQNGKRITKGEKDLMYILLRLD